MENSKETILNTWLTKDLMGVRMTDNDRILSAMDEYTASLQKQLEEAKKQLQDKEDYLSYWFKEFNEVKASLSEKEAEIKELKEKNEGQAMRIGMYKNVDDEIEKYTEDIDSLQKELIYARSVSDEYKTAFLQEQAKVVELEKSYDELKMVNEQYHNSNLIYQKDAVTTTNKIIKLIEALVIARKMILEVPKPLTEEDRLQYSKITEALQSNKQKPI